MEGNGRSFLEMSHVIYCIYLLLVYAMSKLNYGLTAQGLPVVSASKKCYISNIHIAVIT